MKKILFLIVLVSTLLAGCSEYQKLLKSNDTNLKYKKAIVYYNEEQYVKAATLFEELIPVFRGTSKAETVSYYMAYSNYGMGDYITGGYYFRNFIKNFPDSPYAEECLYMSAYCYYKESPKPRLDQTSTQEAIDAFQLYINRYPNSSRIEEGNKLIDELQDKLVYKSYLSARNYFDREHYPSAIIALQNAIKDYPGSSYREELMFMLLESRFEYAVKSIDEKQNERFNLAKEEYFAFVDEFPQSKFKKSTDRMIKVIDAYFEKDKSAKEDN
ncbi:outer membrane protein assembly factor BamD [Ancylomarina salipaludis]|uniref:Outer membrane protein assembly factor BamD n=1 Tax=Ancylomarina salipaludis TaxID=2501299 RepID=A0A4Q1JPL4_9BACT|nr:outer membrane protein assembly factor BamD [Ancylomarina salipaludis]RXQ96176.1 outer membrane protein assembly factor BamD [Ancylomarina salipaludis]